MNNQMKKQMNKQVKKQMNKYSTNIPHCKSEESAAKKRNQQGQGLRTLTPDQMLKRSPMSLA